MQYSSTGYIGVDWGSTSFRAYRFDEHYQLIDTIESKTGIKHIADSSYEATLFSLVSQWIQPNMSILLSGMITSRNGWIETPYLPIPATLDNLVKHSVQHMLRGTQLYFLPGLSQTTPRSDVIRGEELQLFGATLSINNALVVLPGTHSKWAQIINKQVVSFQTIVTGELFDVLLNNTLVGQLANDENLHIEAFERGVHRGFESNAIISELFQCRADVLLEQLSQNQVHSYLSGLLIGNEINEGMLGTNNKHNAVVLIGSALLCKRYQYAFDALSINTIRPPSNTVPTAFRELLTQLD